MGGSGAARSAQESNGLDDDEQAAWSNYLDAALRLYATLNRRLTDAHRLSLHDVRLLAILDHSESGSARMGDLAEQLLSLPSRVTRQIRRLETAGLVRREASPDDRRGVLASITGAGRAAVADAMATYVEGVREGFLRPLTRPQVASMGENSRRLSAAMRASGPAAKFGRP
jgi:DNA-binding MarR family transcriptional regulator